MGRAIGGRVGEQSVRTVRNRVRKGHVYKSAFSAMRSSSSTIGGGGGDDVDEEPFPPLPVAAAVDGVLTVDDEASFVVDAT